jgi:hypothetical protein
VRRVTERGRHGQQFHKGEGALLPMLEILKMTSSEFSGGFHGRGEVSERKRGERLMRDVDSEIHEKLLEGENRFNLPSP